MELPDEKRLKCTHQLSITGVWARGCEGPSILFKLILEEGEGETEWEGGGVSVSLATRLLLIRRAQTHKDVLAVS